MDRENVVRQLAEAWGVFPQQEDELTPRDVYELTKEFGRSFTTTTISNKLLKLKEDGLLSRRPLALEDGGTTYAYRPAEGKSWEDVLQYIK